MSFSELEILLAYDYQSINPVLVDVGGHQGFVSRRFAQKGWKIVAFEPETQNRQLFKSNMASYSNVTCIPKAVSDVDGQLVPFYTSKEHSGIHSLKPFHATHAPEYEVETVRLDNALSELGVSEVTVLKVDTEGADFLALKGLDLVRFRPELIMIEFMDDRSQENFGYTHHDVAKFMNEYGYETFVSEWEPIQEYAKDGEFSSHEWIQCKKYPLKHEPAWGNLIFVLKEEVEKFERTLEQYLIKLERRAPLTAIVNAIRRIPLARKVYGALRR